MQAKIGIVGSSIELKLLKETLEERGIEISYWKKNEFALNILPEELSLLIYELDQEERHNTALLNNLFRRKGLRLFLVAEEISLEEAIELIRKGARDLKLLSTPLELLEKSVLYLLEEKEILGSENFFLTQDPRLLKILGALEEVARTKVPVLLTGESGTGKELLARYIHTKSPRKEGPFIAINCAALPETLLESELFGFEKGAFSGANYKKKGKIELAEGGTLLLDEVTEMGLNLQSKLLRVLQEGEIDRLGGYHPIKVDFRLIATTNRDIEREVQEGRFRADLFYRINVITVKVPPLRERRGDVKLLAKYYLEKFSLSYQKKFKGFTPQAERFLETYSFPGNVRELRNMLERAVITCLDEVIDVKHLTDPFQEDPISKEALQPLEGFPTPSDMGTNFDIFFEEIKPLDEVERETIMKALKLTKGHKSKAAELLGITVRTLRNKLKEYEERGLLPEGGF